MHTTPVPASSPSQSWLTETAPACTHPLTSSPSQWVTVCDNCGRTWLTGQLSTVDGVWNLTPTEDAAPAAPAAPSVSSLLAAMGSGSELASPMELHSLALSALPASDPLVSRHPVSKALAYAAGAVGVAVLALVIGITVAVHSPSLPPCATEDSTTACYWDAGDRSNGEGRSFVVTDDGTVVYR